MKYTSDDIKMSASKIIVGSVTLTGLAASTFIFMRYKVARPSEYLVRTGFGIDGMSITRKGVHWPLQKAMFVNIAPHTFSVDISALSKERIPFLMPSIWTIGPKDDMKSLANYTTLLMDKGDNGLKDIIQGIIQGETRVLTAGMGFDELFSNRDDFKTNIEAKINTIVEVLGLKVYNANVAELSDLDSKNRYFEEQKLRALQRVNQEARVEVSKAVKEGDIGAKTQVAEARKKVSELEMDAVLVENTNTVGVEESKKALEVKKALYRQEIQIALAETDANTSLRTLDLQRNVEEKRNLQRTAELRASLFSEAAINAEVIIKNAEARASAIKIEAEAKLFSSLKEAEGIKASLEAEADGLSSLVSSANGDINGLVSCLLVQKNMLPKLVEEQAKGLQGLNPKINIWNTGQQTPGVNTVINDFFKNSIPMLDQLKDQTGKDILGSLGIKSLDDLNELKK